MQDEHDPVNRTLDLLGTREWSRAGHNLELKERLMSEFEVEHRSVMRRMGRHWVAVLAVLAVASGGFAAVGGAAAIKKLIRINVNGQVTEVDLNEQQEGTITVPTADGGQATIRVKHYDTVDDASGEMPALEGIDVTKIASDAGIGGEMKWITRTADDAGDGPDVSRSFKFVKRIRTSDGQETEDVDIVQEGPPVQFFAREGDNGEIHVFRKMISVGSGEEGGGQAIVKIHRIGDGAEGADASEEFTWTTDGEEGAEGTTGDVRVFRLRGEDGQGKVLKFVGMGEGIDDLDVPELLGKSLGAGGPIRVEIGEDGVPTIHLTGEVKADQVINVITAGLGGADGRRAVMIRAQSGEGDGSGGPRRIEIEVDTNVVVGTPEEQPRN
jgi:hypothetical protein